MSEETKLVLAKMPFEDTLPRVQRMLFRSATYIQDAELEIFNLCSGFLSKDKEIAVKTSTDSKAENLKKQVSEFVAKIEQLKLSVQKAERAVVDGIFDAERNILNQIKLIASNLDVFKVNAFKKVVDGKVVSIM
ncbi:hypothetical protein AHAS_Ahas13G0328200 [Arachis hypogaea]